jgi:predicted DNA binding CopG/RHH family protein
MKHIKLFEDFVNEARSIEKIEKDRTRVINDMAEIVTNWKAAKQSGDKQAEASFLQRLKDLTAEKNGLEKEINTAIASKDRFIELVISENNTIYEGTMSEIDLLAKESKNFKDFVKEFKKEYSDLTDAGDAKELEQWLKTVYDAAQMDEGVTEAEEVKKAIHDHWKELYGEDFISEYPKVAKILKNRPHVDRRELARIWDQVYGEDFKKEYPGMWDRMEEAEEVSERNAFLGARAKAIEEDLEEFEFNGKMYPVLNKSK